ncbi:MAG: Veg family protein [Clostridia bacterium]|nr:Veg family protein [Clostridia bacterium]
MRMIKQTKSIYDVKQMIKTCSDSRVAVKVNLGRNKSICYLGTLSGVYPSLFTVSPDDKHFLGKTTYSYADVLCGNVKIKKV